MTRAGAVLLGSTALLTCFGSPALPQGGSALPPVTVDLPSQPSVRRAPARRNAARVRSAPRRVAAPAPQQSQPADPRAGAPERANGPVNGYVASQSATGTKTDTPILETPQAISVITRDQMVAQQTQSIGRGAALHAGRHALIFIARRRSSMP